MGINSIPTQSACNKSIYGSFLNVQLEIMGKCAVNKLVYANHSKSSPELELSLWIFNSISGENIAKLIYKSKYRKCGDLSSMKMKVY